MGLLYKPDWADAQKHFIAWWQGKSLGCTDLAICAPRDQPQPFPPLPASPHTHPTLYSMNNNLQKSDFSTPHFIRIGTMAGKGATTAKYIASLLPNGFGENQFLRAFPALTRKRRLN